MSEEKSDKDKKADEIRRRYKYRRMIQKGDIKLPMSSAKKLIGPDCAYHLYSRHEGDKSTKD